MPETSNSFKRKFNVIYKLRNDNIDNWNNSIIPLEKGELALAYDDNDSLIEIRAGEDNSTWEHLGSFIPAFENIPKIQRANKILGFDNNGNPALLDPQESSYKLVKTDITDANSKYEAEYSLIKDTAGTASASKVLVTKDYYPTKGTIETVDSNNNPYTGAVAGDKYIRLECKRTDTDIKYAYIPLKDLELSSSNE